jgi:hypothetical protein
MGLNFQNLTSNEIRCLPVVAEILEQGSATLSDEKHWTKGSLARNAYGGQAAPGSSTACKFCMLGAYTKATSQTPGILHALNMDQTTGIVRALGIDRILILVRYFVNQVIREYYPQYHDVINFNDAPDTTHEMVRKITTEAAQRLKEHLATS